MQKILRLDELVEAAGGGQGGSVLEVYDEEWNLFRVESVEPEMIEPDDLAALTGDDEYDLEAVPSVQIRLVLVKRNRPY